MISNLPEVAGPGFKSPASGAPFHPGAGDVLDISASVSSPLEDAVALFNRTFKYDLRLPILPEHVECAAELAGLRGRKDIAQALRLALKQTLATDE